MNILSVFKRVIFPNTYSESAYIHYLKSKKVIIGNNVKVWAPNHTHIDTTKPYLIRIGDYCKITENVTILAHDYSHSVLRRQYGGRSGGGTLPVQIGNNVFIGMNSTILMGTTIGDNCIIGANSVVKGTFPNGCVIAGNPAKTVSTTKEMFDKNRTQWLENAKKTAIAIYQNKGTRPTIEEMSDAYIWMYLPRTKKNIEKYRPFFDLSGDDYEEICKSFMDSKPMFKNFDEFLDFCDL